MMKIPKIYFSNWNFPRCPELYRNLAVLSYLFYTELITWGISTSEMGFSSCILVIRQRWVKTTKFRNADVAKITAAKSISAAGNVSKVSLYNCLNAGFPMIGIMAAKMAKALNTFPVSCLVTHLLRRDLTKPYFDCPISWTPWAT